MTCSLANVRSLPPIALALLVACTAPAPPAATPTAAPAPTSAPTPPPPAAVATSLAAAATPQAVPTVEALSSEQRQQFATAQQRMLDGDYARAVDAWRQLLKLQPPAKTTAEAQFQLALAYARLGNGAEALQLAAQLRADPRAAFVEGMALDASNRHTDAMTALANYAATTPLVAPAVYLEIAERELAANRPKESAEAAATGLNQAQARQLKQRLLEIRAQALAALGNSEAAFDAHRQVLALATNNATLGEQLFRLAEVSRDLGKRDEAIRALKTTLEQFPGASTTADALRLLDELNAADEVDPFILGRARYFAVDYRNAVAAFDRYLQQDPNGPDATAARLYKALASLTPGNEPNALRELDAIADDATQDSELAAQALVEGGQALESLSESDQAAVRYQRLLDRFPRLDAAATAGFRLGLVRFVRGADVEAIAAWDNLIARRDDLTPAEVSRALYFRARAQQRLNRTADARASLAQAAQVRPAGYYALRAAAQLGQLGSLSDQPLADWLASRRLDLSAANATVANDPALNRAQALASIGLLREGNWEVDEVLQRHPDRADRLAALAQRFGELGLISGATRLGDAAMSAASIENPADAPASLRRLAYPRPFAQLIDETAQRYGLDPLLLDATIKDATSFDAWTDDAASGAVGLSRMSPLHAEEAARGLGARGADPFRPAVAIEQHTWLLADRLRRFDSRPEISLAALSTTDRLVDGWLVRPGAEDPDVFLEQIDYEGTRAALRSVLATRITYGFTYGGSLDPMSAIKVQPEPVAGWIKIARLAGEVPPAAPVSPRASVGTPEQRQAFTIGATLQRDGDHAAAIEQFRGLASAGDPVVASTAQLRLGQSLLGAGRNAEAASVLQALEPSADQAFLLARALAQLGQCSNAVDQFQRFIDGADGVLLAHGLTAQAACLLDLGRADEAVALLERATATGDLPRLQTIDLREKLALARLRAGDVEGARADYLVLLSSARSDSYRSELSYILGVVAPDQGAAAARFRSAVQLDPKTRAAQAALDELVSLGDPFALSFEAAETRFEQDRYREALAAYTAFISSGGSDARTPKAFYGRGVSLVRLSQDRAGIQVLESIADRFPNTLDAADGTFRGGRIRESLADLDGAAASYRKAMSQPGAGVRATDAQFRLAFVLFQQRRFAEAAAGWRDLSTRVTAAEDRSQALFWLGKALLAAGDTSAATAALSNARAADPRGFYGLRADDLLAGRADPRASTNLTVPASDPASDIRAWAATRGDVGAAQARLDRDPAIARAERLLALGLRREAIWELDALAARLGNDSPALALLGGWEQQHGLYNTALILAYNLGVSPTSSAATVRKLFYPLPHPVVLQRSAQEQRVDPLLFSALMLQESNMDQEVESAAQARGLSQLIAPTAHEAARALGVYNFHSTDLFRPATSIRLGAYTFASRLARYDRRIFPALAAYNANQFSVDGWLLSAGDADVDTFAEAIPFTETYPYVQRIYVNYRQYLELYAGS